MSKKTRYVANNSEYNKHVGTMARSGRVNLGTPLRRKDNNKYSKKKPEVDKFFCLEKGSPTFWVVWTLCNIWNAVMFVLAVKFLFS